LSNEAEHEGGTGPKDGRGGPAPEKAETRAEKLERRALHEVVHLWIPLGIVLVSVCAAIVGWRASLSEESAVHKEELSRQDLVQQQQLLIQDHSAVDSDIRLFGQFAEYSLLAEQLPKDAGQVGGAVGDQLKAEGQADLSLARAAGKQIVNVNYAFDPSNPAANDQFVRNDGTYKPGHPYDAAAGLDNAENGDSTLHGLEPEPLHAASLAQQTQGVRFIGIAAMFVAVLVLLTFGAVVRGPPKLWFVGSAAVGAVAALSLFLIVLLT
jgi:hypothetical protein